MTRKELIESDEFWKETIDNLLHGYSAIKISKKKFIKRIIELKNEILKNNNHGNTQRKNKRIIQKGYL